MNLFLKLYNRIKKFKNFLKQWVYLAKSSSVAEKYSQEVYYAECFRSAISGSPWLLRQSFMPGGWALDFSGLYLLYRILERMRPSKIVEFGIGESTKIFSQYADHYQETSFFTFEHDQQWMDFFQRSFPLNGKNCVIIERPLETISFHNTKTLRYSGNIGDYTGENIEFIFLDGPYGADGTYARTQVLDLIPNFLNKEKFCIVIDDYNRVGEKNTAKVLLEKLAAAGIAYRTRTYFSLREILIIVSADQRFLVS